MSLLTILRPAVAQDCQAIHNAHLHAVQYTCIRSYDDKVLHAWEALLDIDSYLETISDPGKAFWVVEYRGTIQGFFQVDFKEAQLDALYVHPFVHNHGLGTALLRRAEELAHQAGLSFLTVRLAQLRSFLPLEPLRIFGFRRIAVEQRRQGQVRTDAQISISRFQTTCTERRGRLKMSFFMFNLEISS